MPPEPVDERLECLGLLFNEWLGDLAQNKLKGAGADSEICCCRLGFAARPLGQDFEAALRVETSAGESLSDDTEFIKNLGKTELHGWNEPIGRNFPEVFRNLQEHFLRCQGNPLPESEAIGWGNGQVRERWKLSLKARLLQKYFPKGLQDILQWIKPSLE